MAEKFETFPSSAESGPVAEFYETHCVKRTYLFKVKKCTDKQCRFHEPLNSVEIEDFPDLIPYEVNGILHYKKGTDPEEKNIPSLLLDVSKRPHNIHFPPTAQSGKNVGMLVKCVECKKPSLMHSKTKLKLSECNVLKRSLSGLQYVCCAAFSSYEPDENNDIFAKAYVRENLSCLTDIELTYYSTNIFPDVCIHCGTKQNLVPKSVVNYPRCRARACSKLDEALRRKRKTVTASDLQQKKKKTS